jgi:hypothetical protein
MPNDQLEDEVTKISGFLSSQKRLDRNATVVLVNCQVGGRGNEGEPGFTLV